MTSENPSPRTPYFGRQHPLAEVAERLCETHLPVERAIVGIGGAACGSCWERAIRDDERVVVLFGLPREIKQDPDLVDEIAVDLACCGARVGLTRAELCVVVRRLSVRGETSKEIARRLGVEVRRVERIRRVLRASGAYADDAVGAVEDEEAAA